MVNVSKIERMEFVQDKLLSSIDKARLFGMMRLWEEIEDNWMMFKERIGRIFGVGDERRKAIDVVEGVRRLLAEQKKQLSPDKEAQFSAIAENIAGESIDFYAFVSIKNAIRSRLKGGINGEEKSPTEPLTPQEQDGLQKTIVLVIFNTFGNIKDDLSDEKKRLGKASPATLEKHAKAIGNVLSQSIWNALLIQKPNVILAVNFTLAALSKDYPGFLESIERNTRGSEELHEALFTQPFDRAAGLKVVTADGETFDPAEVDALAIAEKFMQRKANILRAREEAMWLFREILGNKFPEFKKELWDIVDAKALELDPAKVFAALTDLVSRAQATLPPTLEADLRGIGARLSAASIDFATVSSTMNRAVKNRELGGAEGAAKAADEPLSQDDFYGLTQNLAQVIFKTQRGARDKTRSSETTDAELDTQARSIANQLNRPRWSAVLAQAPDMIEFLRTAILVFPRSFRDRVQKQMRATEDFNPAMDQAIFGNVPLGKKESVLDTAAAKNVIVAAAA